MAIPKIAVLAVGLAAAVMVATINPTPAQAYPRAASCASCHGAATPGTVTASPSTATPAPGATYTVAITIADAGNGGMTGYGIVPVAPATEKTFGGNTSSALAYTATMTAPTAAGTYSYTVWTNQGSTDGSGRVGSVDYNVTVAGAPVAVTTTTSLAVTPASPAVAPASPTLKATVTGTGAAGTVEFFNGTTSLGTPGAISAGVATKALAGVAAGSYAYTAKFVPTSAAAFTPSTSSVSSYVVTPSAPVVVTTTTALAVTPASPAVAPASPTLKATVTGTGAAGTVEFFNGTTSLGTPGVISAGVATKALAGVVAGSYAYTAKFVPTSAAAFTPSTSSVSSYVVTAAPVVLPSASFTASAISGIAPLAVTFTDTSIGAPTSWLWTFGNGSTSNLQNPLPVSYAAAGTYTVTLIASNANGASTAVTKTITVTAAPVVLPTASFTASAITGVAPLAVTFTDTSIGSPTSWLWTFGNGSTSNAQNPPAVSYTTAGTYMVTLIVSNANGASTAVTKTITVMAPPVSTASISGLSPKRAAIGTTVTINGSNFGTTGLVKLGEVLVTTSSWTDTAITFVVPAGTHGRTAAVTVTPEAGTPSSSVSFRFAKVRVPHVG